VSCMPHTAATTVSSFAIREGWRSHPLDVSRFMAPSPEPRKRFMKRVPTDPPTRNDPRNPF